jgi:hypothetical protein
MKRFGNLIKEELRKITNLVGSVWAIVFKLACTIFTAGPSFSFPAPSFSFEGVGAAFFLGSLSSGGAGPEVVVVVVVVVEEDEGLGLLWEEAVALSRSPSSFILCSPRRFGFFFSSCTR